MFQCIVHKCFFYIGIGILVFILTRTEELISCSSAKDIHSSHENVDVVFLLALQVRLNDALNKEVQSCCYLLKTSWKQKVFLNPTVALKIKAFCGCMQRDCPLVDMFYSSRSWDVSHHKFISIFIRLESAALEQHWGYRTTFWLKWSH